MSDTQQLYDRGSLKPYLELPHLLSLTWLAYPILSLLFVAFRLQLSLGSAEDAISRAKDNLVASCNAAEQAATATASMPRYLALATNEQYADAVNASMNAARQALVLSLTVMEAIINFIIDIYRSTFLCFLELVIRGGLAIIITAVDELKSVVESVSGGLKTSIQNDISSANSAIQSAIDGINKVNPFSDISAPQIPIPDLSSLDNVTLPSSISDTLNQLNSSLPTFQDLKDKIEQVIDTPFELVKKDINDTFANMSFNSSALPVPAQNRLSFCGNVDTSVVDDLGHDIIKTAKIGVIILIILALLLLGANCLLEWYKWRCMRQHLEYTRQAWMTDPILYHSKSPSLDAPPTMTLTDHNLLILQSNSEHPLITRITNQMASKLRLSPSKHSKMQWFFAYIFHAPALACLLIGVFGLISVQLQLFALDPLVKKYEDRAASSVADFNNLITSSVNANMQNQSSFYAESINSQVDEMQNNLNNGLFGWVNGTTTTLNQTLNEFYSDVQNAVTLVFNNTFMEQPAQEFIRCLIGTKVDALENALTFLHDNLVVNVPRMNDTVLMLSPDSVNEATRPVAAAAIGGGDDDDTGLVGKVVNAYAEGLKKERIMFAIFIGLWGIVVLMAIFVLLWHSYVKPARERRRRRKYEADRAADISGFVLPYRSGKGSPSSGRHDDLTPLPSPKVETADPFGRAGSPPQYSQDSTSRDSFSVQEKTSGPKPISKPMKLMAIGRKAMGRETLVPDNGARGFDEKSDDHREQRNTAWFGRFAAMLSKGGANTSESEHSARRASRPNLRISIEQASTRTSAEETTQDRSRWSSSPDARSLPQFPWMTRRISGVTPLPPPGKPAPLPQSNLGTSPPHPPIGVPIRTHHHNANVPSDVTATSYEDPLFGGAPGFGQPLAPPLHHGFHRPAQPQGIPKSPYPQPPTPPAPPRPGLAPPKDHHRRSVSVPASKFKGMRISTSGPSFPAPPPSLQPLTPSRLETTNPFTTPFDDEHRVQISPPAYAARRSIPTNPFTPMAL